MTRNTFLDFAERIVLALFAASFIIGFTPSLTTHPYNWLVLAGEMATLVFIMIRRPGAIAVGVYPIAIGFLGTLLPLLVRPVDNVIVPPVLAIIVMMFGLMISFSSKLFLNRSFGIVAANRGTKRAGPYRLIRHPMYAGYMLTHVGVLMVNFSAWNLVVLVIAWAMQLLRIREEEAFLLRDPEYQDYAATVPRRLIPGAY